VAVRNRGGGGGGAGGAILALRIVLENVSCSCIYLMVQSS
jgi:hypothetical protein